jgi:hypothetical protein
VERICAGANKNVRDFAKKVLPELEVIGYLIARLIHARAGVKVVRFGRDKSGAQEKGKKRGASGYLGFAQR